MNDLMDFKNLQIQALQKKLLDEQRVCNELKQYLFELTDKDCPTEYKQVIRLELFKNKLYE